ncbi:2-phosphosulfolactate phosphatase [Parapedobacter lycopersici]|uniref:2-phosphosulfolactate phosphatase n=1 Tax=Parapedobacter lycopersici TaxID=1864939 RepID=UPI00214DE383|nr:2-phosphosulfolactate phosphatase [Parapedobacter lycopersici]
MDSRKIQVCLSPALLPFYDKENTVAVVIDIFRASSSICYGLANGAEAIIPVAEVDECRAYEGRMGCLLAAERNGEVVPGFDFGNSPFSYTANQVKGKTVVLTTTNGTRAIQQCLDASTVAIGSFLNITALVEWLRGQDRHVLLVCAGWKNHVSLEDSLFAGAVVARLKTSSSLLDDSAHMTAALFAEAREDIAGYLNNSAHALRMRHLDLAKDIAFCLQQDLVSTIPVLHNGRLVGLPTEGEAATTGIPA